MACDQNSIPSYADLGLPVDANVGMTPKNNQSIAAMERCCSPNPVGTAMNCTLWCELPDFLMELVDEGSDMSAVLGECMKQGGQGEGIMIIGGHPAESLAIPATRPTTAAGLGMLVLLMINLMAS